MILVLVTGMVRSYELIGSVDVSKQMKEDAKREMDRQGVGKYRESKDI